MKNRRALAAGRPRRGPARRRGDELVAQAVSGWTEAFQPAFAQDAGRWEAVAPLLEKGLKAIAQQVLSAEAVGMFRLLQSEFPGREGMLESYQRNGIQPAAGGERR